MQKRTAALKTDNAEVTGISPFGIRILVGGVELFIRYREYPSFDGASIKDIADVEEDSMGNLHWPQLDIDIEADSLKNPEKYPLIYS
jgi:hypothetical protein